MNISDRINEIIKALTELRDGIIPDDSVGVGRKQSPRSAVLDKPLILDDGTWLDDCGFPLVEISTSR